MIKYKRNIIDMMAEKGITTYLIRKIRYLQKASCNSCAMIDLSRKIH